MNAITTSEQTTLRRSTKITEAIEAFKQAHPDANEARLAHFENNVTASIEKSEAKTKYLNSKTVRRERKAELKSLVEANKIKFISITVLHEVNPKVEVIGEDGSIPRDFLSKVLGVLKTTVPLTYTLAFQYFITERGNVGMKGAFAYQNPSDDSDKLYGKEVAVARLMANETVAYEMVSEDFERGIRLETLEDLSEAYRKQYINK